MSANPTDIAASHGRKVLLLAFCATMSVVMGVTSVMPMLPMLAREFGVSPTQASLVLTVFTLPGILFALPAGILADRFGRKAVLVPSFFLFGLAGTACAFVTDFNALLFFRALQGMGAISLGVLNTTIIADVWPGRDLPKMVGYNMTVLSVCTALYPVIGGALAYANWHYTFLLPLLALPAGFVALHTPLVKPEKQSGLTEYLSHLGHAFQDRRLLLLLGMTLLTFVLLYGPIITGFPLLADVRFEANSAMIGLAMIASSSGTALMSLRIGHLSHRISSAGLLFRSQGGYILALLALPWMPALWWALVPLFLYGMAQGLNVNTVQAQLLLASPPELRASIMSVNGMLLRLGQSIAPVTFSAVMTGAGMDWGYYSAIVLVLLLAALTLLLRRGPNCSGR